MVQATPLPPERREIGCKYVRISLYRRERLSPATGRTSSFPYVLVSRKVLLATTVLAVRHNGRSVMASDGQVTFGTRSSSRARERFAGCTTTEILAGFAGSAADSFALFARFEAKLEQYRGNLERSAVELAKDWRTDRILRRLEAMLIVMDGAGHVSAVRHRRSHRAGRWDHGDRIGRRRTRWRRRRRWRATRRSTRAGSREQAMQIAGGICIYTNSNITIEEI